VGMREPRYPANDNKYLNRIESYASASPKSELRFVRASDIVMEPIHWLWPGVLLKNAFSLLVGYPSHSKSTVSLDIAARLTSGADWPVTEGKATASNVLILSAEDVPSYTIVPRLKAMGADTSRIFILDLTEGEPFDLERGVELLDRSIHE